MEDEFFVEVEQLPFIMQFNLSDLFPHTEYCVQGVGAYVSGEITAGMGIIAITDSKSVCIITPDNSNSHISTVYTRVLTWIQPPTQIVICMHD